MLRAWTTILATVLVAASPPAVDRSELDPWPASSDHAIIRAVWAINDRRKLMGLPYLTIDAGLNRAAAESARRVGAGLESPHAGFPARVRAEGWPAADCGIRNAGFGNATEGITWGGRTPEQAVLILDSADDPAEGHRRDFEDPRLTHVGVGFAANAAAVYARYGGRVCVVDYAARCQ